MNERELSPPTRPWPNAEFWVLCGVIACGLAVTLGAFAAHGLGPRLNELYGDVDKEIAGQKVPGPVKYLADFKTAAEYQMTHGLALIALGLVAKHRRSALIRPAGWCLLWGIVLFSGSLYVLVLTGITKLGMITPIGGVLFLVGWGLFAGVILSGEKTHDH